MLTFMNNRGKKKHLLLIKSFSWFISLSFDSLSDKPCYLELHSFNLRIPTSCFFLNHSIFRSAAGQISIVCGQQPAAGGALDGLPHCESLGGCCVGGVEHRRLHLWLHPHQRHGAAHPHPGEGDHHTPVCHRAAVSRSLGTLHLHPCEETLIRLGGGGHRVEGLSKTFHSVMINSLNSSMNKMRLVLRFSHFQGQTPWGQYLCGRCSFKSTPVVIKHIHKYVVLICSLQLRLEMRVQGLTEPSTDLFSKGNIDKIHSLICALKQSCHLLYVFIVWLNLIKKKKRQNWFQ